MSHEVVVLMSGGHELVSTHPDEAGAQSVYMHLEDRLKQNPVEGWQYNWGDDRFNIKLSAVVGYAMREKRGERDARVLV